MDYSKTPQKHLNNQKPIKVIEVKVNCLAETNCPYDLLNVFEEFSSNTFNSMSSSLVSSRYFPVGTSNLIFIILTRFNVFTL